MSILDPLVDRFRALFLLMTCERTVRGSVLSLRPQMIQKLH